jgi:hypothetical protein
VSNPDFAKIIEALQLMDEEENIME